MAAQLGPSLYQLRRGLSVVQPNRDLVIMETNAFPDYKNVSRRLVKTNTFFIVRIRQLVKTFGSNILVCKNSKHQLGIFPKLLEELG